MVRSWLRRTRTGLPFEKKSAALDPLMEAGGGVKESIRHKPRYTDEQNRLPLNIILTTAAAWRLPADTGLSLQCRARSLG